MKKNCSTKHKQKEIPVKAPVLSVLSKVLQLNIWFRQMLQCWSGSGQWTRLLHNGAS